MAATQAEEMSWKERYEKSESNLTSLKNLAHKGRACSGYLGVPVGIVVMARFGL